MTRNSTNSLRILLARGESDGTTELPILYCVVSRIVLWLRMEEAGYLRTKLTERGRWYVHFRDAPYYLVLQRSRETRFGDKWTFHFLELSHSSNILPKDALLTPDHAQMRDHRDGDRSLIWFDPRMIRQIASSICIVCTSAGGAFILSCTIYSPP